MKEKLGRGAFAAVVILVLSGTAGLESAAAQAQAGKHDKSQRNKKPGTSCETIAHGTTPTPTA